MALHAVMQSRTELLSNMNAAAFCFDKSCLSAIHAQLTVSGGYAFALQFCIIHVVSCVKFHSHPADRVHASYTTPVLQFADIKPAVIQKPQPVAKLLPVSTKCLNDAVVISPKCRNVGGFLDATSPRCAYASRVRRSLTSNPQSSGSNRMLPDIPLGRYRQ